MKFWHFLLIIMLATGSYFLYKYYVNDQLIQAVKSNDIETAKTALKWGADVDHYGWDRDNTLSLAIDLGHPEMVQLLLDNEASMDIQRGTRTALEYSQAIRDGERWIWAPTEEEAERWQNITVPKQHEIILIIEREIQKRMKE